jgi:formylglycine-generating enzyme required for sulfatase activity
MHIRFSSIFIGLVILLPLLLSCGGESPFKRQDARIYLFLENSSGQKSPVDIIDTVEKTVHIGMTTYLPNFIDVVTLTVVKATGDTDTVKTFTNISAWPDTQWIHIVFHSTGTRTVTAVVHVQGEPDKSFSANITIAGKPVQIAVDPASTSANENSSALFFVKASGAGQSFSYQWFKDGAIISNAADDTLVINPVLVSSAGRYDCVIKNQWGDSITSAPALLTVIQNPAVNHKPLLAVSGTKNITPGQTCRLYLSATDIDAGQTFTYNTIKGPAGGTLTDTVYFWTPAANYTGTDTVVFSVTDNGTPALSDTLKVAITVSSQIQPPARVQGIKSVARLGGYFVFTWNKIGNADSYLIYRSPDRASFTALSPSSDTLAGDSTHSSNYYYFIVAKNSAGTSPSSDTIYSGDVNVKPQWKHNATSVNVKEGLPLVMTLSDSCIDPNGDVVSFALVPGAPNGDTILGGIIYSYSPGYSDSGSYTVRIAGTDGRLSDTLTMNLHVANQNRPPVFDTDMPKTSIAIKGGAQLSFGINATDPDGDLVTYAVKSSTLPRTLPVLNAGTVTWQSVMSDSGLFNIVLQAKDATDSTAITVQVAVGKVNAPPSVSIPGVTKGQKLFVREMDTLRFTVHVSDPDSATEKLTLRLADRSLFTCGTVGSFDSTSGLFVFVPSYNCAARDTLLIPSVQFIGTDNGSPVLCDTFSLSIGIINKNRPPVMGSLRDTAISENQALSFKVSAADPDSNTTLILSVSGMPSWATFTPATGMFTGTTAYGQAGKYTVTFKATDNGTPPLADSIAIVITVSLGPPKADFSPSVTSGEIPLAVTFTNNSLNATSYAWDFGDGNSSTVASPVYTYMAPGNYIVKLLATGTAIDSMKKVIVVTRPAAPSNVAATPGVCSIRLTWTKGATSASDTVYYAEGDTVTEATGTKIGNTVSPLTITNLKIGVKYSLAVVSCNSKGGKSNLVYVKATTVAPAGMKLIPAAYKTFFMGQYGVMYAEPVHTVSFNHNFYLDSTEVTREDFNAIMSTINPGFIPISGLVKGAVTQINYFDAVLYCNARSKRDGLDTVYRFTGLTGIPGNGCILKGLNCDSLKKTGYHLPTEAQWEYAARGGTTTDNYWTNLTDSNPDQYAWTISNSFAIQAVAQLKPNDYGLYDVCGNAAEYCNDSYYDYTSQSQIDPVFPAASDSSTTVLVRGWSCFNPAQPIAMRNWFSAGTIAIFNYPVYVIEIGLRVCLSLKY